MSHSEALRMNSEASHATSLPLSTHTERPAHRKASTPKGTHTERHGVPAQQMPGVPTPGTMSRKQIGPDGRYNL
ncbi:hypothetical protein FHS27_003402 [Rhodopirellula rubra]|uniref:Uncharacterized protein n=1 Tax=Aporhodopirellula rubra TaxID=980271 RepID=A0A7W5H5K1_9BACT|nr:hypothetical protein [Aporhodopirellula rubra]